MFGFLFDVLHRSSSLVEQCFIQHEVQAAGRSTVLALCDVLVRAVTY